MLLLNYPFNIKDSLKRRATGIKSGENLGLIFKA